METTTVALVKDFRGQEIHASDVVVYPNRQGSRMWLVEARVTEVRGDSLRVQREDGKIKTITRIDRVVVVESQHANV